MSKKSITPKKKKIRSDKKKVKALHSLSNLLTSKMPSANVSDDTDLNYWLYYRCVTGFLMGKYIDVTFIAKTGRPLNIRISSHVTECEDELVDLLNINQ